MAPMGKGKPGFEVVLALGGGPKKPRPGEHGADSESESDTEIDGETIALEDAYEAAVSKDKTAFVDALKSAVEQCCMRCMREMDHGEEDEE